MSDNLEKLSSTPTQLKENIGLGEISSEVQELLNACLPEDQTGNNSNQSSKKDDKAKKTEENIAKDTFKQQITKQIIRVASLTKENLIRSTRKAINDEIKTLEKDLKKYSNFTKFDPYHYNKTVNQIRHLKEILVTLVHKTLKQLREYYIKFVMKFKINI